MTSSWFAFPLGPSWCYKFVVSKCQALIFASVILVIRKRNDGYKLGPHPDIIQYIATSPHISICAIFIINKMVTHFSATVAMPAMQRRKSPYAWPPVPVMVATVTAPAATPTPAPTRPAAPTAAPTAIATVPSPHSPELVVAGSTWALLVVVVGFFLLL